MLYNVFSWCHAGGRVLSPHTSPRPTQKLTELGTSFLGSIRLVDPLLKSYRDREAAPVRHLWEGRLCGSCCGNGAPPPVPCLRRYPEAA